jgi:guanylate kinase
MKRSRLIFVKAPTTGDLEDRIRKRGAETEDQLRTRMQTAERELTLEGTYDYVVINEDVSRATDELVDIVRSVGEEPATPPGEEG